MLRPGRLHMRAARCLVSVRAAEAHASANLPASCCSPHLQSRRLLATVHVCCCNLLAAAADEAGCFGRPLTGSGSDAAKPHMQAISAACYALESALKRLPFDFPPPPSLATLRMYQRAVVPSAAALARALLAYWHSDKQLQTGRLAAARAAAARSCSYLHCANLDSEGGARAGTGVGSSRCR